MDTIKRLSPRLKLQANIVGAGILYMPPWFVPINLLQMHPFLTILYFDLLISMIGQ